MSKSLRDFMVAANEVITTHDVAAAMALVDDDSVLFVDVRDRGELEAHGKIPGALHASRGMLEFHIDPTSPFHINELGSGRRLVFYCAGGGRSALAALTATEMGCEDVAHIAGGYGAWVQAGGPVEK